MTKQSLWRRSCRHCIGWISAIWSRLLRAEDAYQALFWLVQRHVHLNLFVDAHGNPQVGDGEAIPNAVLEMLVQNTEERVTLLPALPKQWPDGEVKGLHVYGGAVLDFAWKNGAIETLTVHRENVFAEIPIIFENEPLFEKEEKEDCVIYTKKD